MLTYIYNLPVVIYLELKRSGLFFRELPAPREKPHALGRLKRETRAAARHRVDNKLGVLPILELGAAHANSDPGKRMAQ